MCIYLNLLNLASVFNSMHLEIIMMWTFDRTLFLKLANPHQQLPKQDKTVTHSFILYSWLLRLECTSVVISKSHYIIIILVTITAMTILNNLSVRGKDLLCVQCEWDKIDVSDILYMVSAIRNVKDNYKPFKRMRK